MTREEFIKQRCEIDKITLEEFEEQYRVVDCNCGKPYCKGYRCLDLDDLLKENEQLKIQISAREEVCNRLESNWNKLREYIVENNKTLCWTNNYDAILGKMEELQGSDNNDTNR